MGVYNGSPLGRHCKHSYRSPTHILSTTYNPTHKCNTKYKTISAHFRNILVYFQSQYSNRCHEISENCFNFL